MSELPNNVEEVKPKAVADARQWMTTRDGQQYRCVSEFPYFTEPHPGCVGCIVIALVRAVEAK